MHIRTYGWIQNPSSFTSLKKVVQIFDKQSVHYKELKKTLIQKYIYFIDDKKRFQSMLDCGQEEFQYIDLVGTARDMNNLSPKKRADAIGNGLIQISITPQQVNNNGKHWTDNWTSDGFLRWAVSLNFVKTDRQTDIFKITPLGLAFSRSTFESDEEKRILTEALLAYPPAFQVLSILNESPGTFRSKYYIGSRLGFQGEKGFTSYNEDLIFDWLSESTPSEKKKIKSNVEGTADKYARGIANWLRNLGLIQSKSIFKTFKNGRRESLTGYAINAKGKHAFQKALGSSKNEKITKYLMWEFLATNVENRNYIRTRRAYILKFLQETKSFPVLMNKLTSKGFKEVEAVIKNDIKGLNTFGIRIDYDNKKVVLKDLINDFDIPNLNITAELKLTATEKLKSKFMTITDLPVKFYELLDIAFDGTRNRDFELITAELFRDVYGLNSILLGGGRKPDGLIFTDKFGIIIDTKAYGQGYSKNITQADEMIRYIEDNKKRDIIRNNITWWENFNEHIPENNFYFLWVSSKFIGRFQEQIEYTAHATQTNGGALNVEQLLLGADAVLKGNLDPNNIPNYMQNNEIIFVNE